MKVRNVFLAAVFVAVTSASAQAQTTQRTLFVGNSYIYVNNVDKLYEQIALDSAGSQKLHIQRISPGGYRLSSHGKDADKPGSALNKALSNKQSWDYIILQEQSQTPGLAPANIQLDSQNGAVRIVSALKRNDGTAVLYLTWARRDAPGTRKSEVAAFKKMQNALTSGYEDIAKKIHAAGVKVKIAPVGRAFEHAYDTHGVEFFRTLYQPDGSHPSLAGAYMAAIVIYATIHNVDPTKVSWTPKGLTESVAKKIRSSAKEAISKYKIKL